MATRNSDKIGPFTRGYIRQAAHEFCEHNSRTGRTGIGPVWMAIGPTARQAMFKAAIFQNLIVMPDAPDDFVWTVGDMRAVQQAFIDECTAIGITVFDRGVDSRVSRD